MRTGPASSTVARPGGDLPPPGFAGPVPSPEGPRHRLRPAGAQVRSALPAVVAVILVWLVVVLVTAQVQVDPALRDLARFGHLAALVLGFGAALTVEWFGLLWLLRRRPLIAVTQVAQGTHVPIWLGLAGLTLTGVVLSPGQLTVAGSLKLVAVLVVALNGIHAGRLQQALTEAAPAVPRSILARAAAAAMVSQLGWWGAVTIGFLNTHT